MLQKSLDKDGKTLLLKDSLLTLGGLLLFLLFWQIASMGVHGLVIASPHDTLAALWRMVFETDFFGKHVTSSVKRIFTGIFMGSAAGFLLGIVAGLSESIKKVLEPCRWVLMSVPAVVVVVVAMLWFGMGTSMVVFITSVLLSPIVYVNTVKGMEAVDEKLLEMAAVYGFSFWMKIKYVYLMSIVSHLSAAMAVVTGNGVRLVILAEVLGTNDGIGYALSTARTNLEIPDLFACVLLSLIIVGGLEYLLLRPILNRLWRWRK